jgi:hypothetical protein
MRLFLVVLLTLAGFCSGCRTAAQREFLAIAAEEQEIHGSSTLTEGQKLSSLEQTAAKRRALNSRLRDEWDSGQRRN